MPFLARWGDAGGVLHAVIPLLVRTAPEREVLPLRVRTAPAGMERARVVLVVRTQRPAVQVAHVQLHVRTAPLPGLPAVPAPVPGPVVPGGVAGPVVRAYAFKASGLDGVQVEGLEVQGGYEQGRVSGTLEVLGEVLDGEYSVMLTQEAVTSAATAGRLLLPRLGVTSATVRHTPTGPRSTLTVTDLRALDAERGDAPLGEEFLPWLRADDLTPQERAEKEVERHRRERLMQDATCEERDALHRAEQWSPVLVHELIAWLLSKTGAQVVLEGPWPFEGEALYPSGEVYEWRGARWVGADVSVKGKRPLEALAELLAPVGYRRMDYGGRVWFFVPPDPVAALGGDPEALREVEYRNAGTGLSGAPVPDGRGPFSLPAVVHVVGAAQVHTLPLEDLGVVDTGAELRDGTLTDHSQAFDEDGKLVSITRESRTKAGGRVVAERREVDAWLDAPASAGWGAPRSWGSQEVTATEFTYGAAGYADALALERSVTHTYAVQLGGPVLSGERRVVHTWGLDGVLQEKVTVNTTLDGWEFLGFSLVGGGTDWGVKLHYRPHYSDEVTRERWVDLGRGLWRHTLDVTVTTRFPVLYEGETQDTVTQTVVQRADSSVTDQAPPSVTTGQDCRSEQEREEVQYEVPLRGTWYTGGRGEALEVSLPFVTQLDDGYARGAVGNRAQPMARRTYSGPHLLGLGDLAADPRASVRLRAGALTASRTREEML